MQPPSLIRTIRNAFYFLGDSLASGFAGSAVYLSSFLTSGVVPGFAGLAFGSTDGLTAGDDTGNAGDACTGVVGLVSGLFGVELAAGSHAENAKVPSASADAKMIELFIDFSSKFTEHGLRPPAS